MESKVKLLGHPIHPTMVVFPLGLFTLAVLLDLVNLVWPNAEFAVVSFWTIAGGVVGGLGAAVFGFLDWLHVPAGTRARRIGLMHGAGNAVVLALFAVSLFLRWGAPGYLPSTLALALGVIGVLLITATSWLGGELVDRLGIGVDEGAHPNASNSLSGRPAHENLPPGERPHVPARSSRG
jgi:uncharacterized membrane protein